MTAVTYLTCDEVAHGVGASQVLPYVEGLASKGAGVTLHSFEHQRPPARLRQRLDDAGVQWHPHRFVSGGSTAGLGRVLYGAALVRGGGLVHARSDLSAAAALLARSQTWVWDVRSLWADQRIAMGMLRRGSPEDRVLRSLEAAAATQASAVVALTTAAIDVLAERHGDPIRAKAVVIPTCADLNRFPVASMPDPARLELLLSGSFNRLYDLDVTLGFVAAVQRLQPAALTLLTNGSSCWERRVSEVGGVVASVPFAEMPGRVQASHAGLSICRTDDSAAIAGALPTKIAEFLATGRPVVVNAGLGDMDTLLARHRCGVVLRDNSREGLDDAAHRLSALVEDDLTPKRCRAAAIEHFDLDEGVTKLLEVYRSVEAGTGSSRGLLTGSQR